ncbi:MAG: GNAT family N-acetyltransferase [Planctomycetota bacterium]
MKLLIRPANKKDIDSIVALSGQTARLMRQISPAGFGKTLSQPIDIKKETKWYRQAVGDKEKAVFVAERNGKVRGYLMGVIEKYPDDLLEPPYLTVQYLCVDKKSRRLGIGQALMREIEKWARNKKISTLELIVYNNNHPARELFHKMRYLPLEIRMAKRL